MGEDNQLNKKIKFCKAGSSISDILWWISFFTVIWLEHNGRYLNNVENTIYYAIVFVLIITGVICRERKRQLAREDTDKRMKMMTRIYIGTWVAWAIEDLWFLIWGIYLEHDVFIPYLIIVLVLLAIICVISLARNSTFP